METGTNIVKNGKIIHTSKNLWGILDYARKSPVVRIESCRIGDVSGTVRVLYKDGAESRANFRSYHIMIDWIRNRKSWKTVKHVMQDENIGYLTKPGIIAGK